MHACALPQIIVEISCDSFQVLEEEHEDINLIQLCRHCSIFCIGDLDLCSIEGSCPAFAEAAVPQSIADQQFVAAWAWQFSSKSNTSCAGPKGAITTDSYL